MPMFGKRAPNYFARPTVSAYTPTPRDQVANLFLRVAGDTYDNRRFARNLFGSSGIGGGGANPTGIGLMDLTPAGIPFQLNEAGAQIGAGRPVSGLANAALAVVPIPAAAKGARGMIGRGARRAADKAKGIVAYHGSPHTFDAFDASKIGTGEGAQADGHGLYFAENEGGAKEYRRQLADDTFRVSDGEVWGPHTLEHMNLRVAARRNGPDLDATLALARDLRPRMPPATQQMVDRDIAKLEQLKARGGVTPNPGSMYQVRINADPNAFLDHDSSLRLQPEMIKKLEPYRAQIEAGLAERGTMARTLESANGALVYDILTGANQKPYDPLAGLTKSLGQTDRGAPHMASDTLKQADIPGIKYLDAGSRGAGDGSRNYVVFDPKIIDIMKRYGVAAPVAAMIAAGQMRPPPTPSRP